MIQAIIKQAADAGVGIVLSAEGAIDITGREEIIACWLPVLRQHKGDIQAALQGIKVATHRDSGREKSVTSVSSVFRPPVEKNRQEPLPSSAGLIPIEAIKTFRAGFPWITAHLAELLAAGWTRRELFGRGRYRWPIGDWGAAWTLPFGQPDKIPNIGRRGEIVFTFANCHGDLVRQTAWPVKLLLSPNQWEGRRR
jgi:hypothetical protein